MRNFVLPALAVAALTGCGAPSPEPSLVLMPVTVSLPAEVGAAENLPVLMKSADPCVTFKELEPVARSAQALSLMVYGVKEKGCAIKPVPGPRPAGKEPTRNGATGTETPYVIIFSDSASEPRLSPFEVWVNGARVGTVMARE